MGKSNSPDFWNQIMRGGVGRLTFFFLPSDGFVLCHGYGYFFCFSLSLLPLSRTPRSSYPHSALPPMSYFHQPVTGEIGKHLPKEMVRIERDWSGGEMCQCVTLFSPKV